MAETKVSATPGSYPPPGTSPFGERMTALKLFSPLRYCAIGYARQAAVVFTGTGVPSGCTRSTPSSVEQKLRLPVDFGAIGALPATNAALYVPPPVSPVARKVYPLLPADPGVACASTLSRMHAVAAVGVHGAAPPSSAIDSA